jgi:hypothetical protein
MIAKQQWLPCSIQITVKKLLFLQSASLVSVQVLKVYVSIKVYEIILSVWISPEYGQA